MQDELLLCSMREALATYVHPEVAATASVGQIPRICRFVVYIAESSRQVVAIVGKSLLFRHETARVFHQLPNERRATGSACVLRAACQLIMAAWPVCQALLVTVISLSVHTQVSVSEEKVQALVA